MEFRILGSLEVEGAEGLIDLRGAKRRGLLACLVVHAGQPLSTDRLVEELWGDGRSGGAAQTVQTYVSQLRNLLEGEAASLNSATGLCARGRPRGRGCVPLRARRDGGRRRAGSNAPARDARWRTGVVAGPCAPAAGEVHVGPASDTADGWYPRTFLLTDIVDSVSLWERDPAGMSQAALDGIPLAIELAAGRLRSLSLPDLAARLDDRLLMMTHGKDSPARLNGRSEL